MTNKTKEHQLKELLSAAEQAYDEVKLKIHVAGVEAKKEWHGLQDQWVKFQHDCACWIQQAKKSGVSIDDSLHVIGKEFMSAFQHIKDACNKE